MPMLAKHHVQALHPVIVICLGIRAGEGNTYFTLQELDDLIVNAHLHADSKWRKAEDSAASGSLMGHKVPPPLC